MTATLTAVFENGVLRPTAPPDIPDGATVRLLVLPPDEPPTAPAGFLAGWIGSIRSDVPDWGTRHNELLGEAHHEDARGRQPE